MTRTPICDFVREYIKTGAVRAHMPAHKGAGPIGAEPLDITEIAGADELYRAEGIIRESEENAARLFGTGRTLYSTEGSSLAIRAMLYLALLNAKSEARAAHRPKARRYTVLAARNAHKTLASACALLDLDIEWLLPNGGDLLACRVGARQLDEALTRAGAEGKPPVAVYLTSPDYLGNEQNIRELALACHWHGVPLAVDNAHGAYLRFLAESRHPIDLGADICCDSAHKTLPCLTGAAYLHISKFAPSLFKENAERALALFASTSPSYLILQSLDAANAYLETEFPEKLAAFAEKLAALKQRLIAAGFETVGNEELKLTLAAKRCGYTGRALAGYLRENGVECEFADEDYLVLMLAPGNGESALRLIEAALLALEKRPPIEEKPPVPALPERVLSVREAVLAPQRTLPLGEALGCIVGNDYCSCPPAVPAVIPGERLDEAAAACLRYYGVRECTVVEE